MNTVTTNIETLSLEIQGADEQSYRAEPIARRASEILGELLQGRLLAIGVDAASHRLDEIVVPTLAFDLRVTSDDEAARKIAEGVFHSIVRELGIGRAL